MLSLFLIGLSSSCSRDQSQNATWNWYFTVYKGWRFDQDLCLPFFRLIFSIYPTDALLFFLASSTVYCSLHTQLLLFLMFQSLHSKTSAQGSQFFVFLSEHFFLYFFLLGIRVRSQRRHLKEWYDALYLLKVVALIRASYAIF